MAKFKVIGRVMDDTGKVIAESTTFTDQCAKDIERAIRQVYLDAFPHPKFTILTLTKSIIEEQHEDWRTEG